MTMRDYTGPLPRFAKSAGFSLLQTTTAQTDDDAKYESSYHQGEDKEQRQIRLSGHSQTEQLEDPTARDYADSSSTMSTRSKSTQKETVGPLPVSHTLEHTPKLDPAAQYIIRTHLAEQLLPNLRDIQEHCGTPSAAVYVEKILRTVRNMRDRTPFDPYLEVAMALHDALAFENNWVDYDASQYEGAYHILDDLLSTQKLGASQIEKAIVQLEELGFDTTPFGMGFDDGD